MPAIPMLAIALFVCINKVITGKVKYVVYIAVLLLVFVQNFYTLDPLTQRLFRNISVGDTDIITTRTYVKNSDGQLQTEAENPDLLHQLDFTQSAVYNRQYYYFQKVFEKMLSEIDYNNDVFIGIAPVYGAFTWQAYFGDWYNYELYYDAKKNHVVTDSNMPIMNVEVVDARDELDLSSYKRAYIVIAPYNKEFNTEEYLKSFRILDSESISSHLFELQIYQIK